jgi:hypothetical protein
MTHGNVWGNVASMENIREPISNVWGNVASMENIRDKQKNLCFMLCFKIFKDLQMLKIMLNPYGFLVFSDPPGLGLQERQLLLLPRFQWLLMAIKIFCILVINIL